MRIISYSIFLSLLMISSAQGMSHVKGAAVGTVIGGSSTLAGIGYGSMIGGPGGALVGGIIGTVVGVVGGGYGGIVVQDDQEKLEKARKERAAQEAAGTWVSIHRIGKALDAQEEYGRAPVNANEHADFVDFENGKGALVVSRRAFASRQPQELDAIVARINQKLLLLRQRHGMPVDACTGNYIELNARRAAGQTAIDNPSAEQIRVAKTLLENPEFNELFQDLEKLFIAGKLFWRQSNKPTETLKTVMAHVRWATLNAYSLPLLEKLDQEQAQLATQQAQHQQKTRENEVLRGEKQQAQANFVQERINYNGMVERFNREQEQRLKAQADLAQRAQQLKNCENEIEGMVEVLPMIQRNTKKLEEENVRMHDELAYRRAQSPERRAQLAAKDAEIEKLKRDLTLSREAFASCKLTNP